MDRAQMMRMAMLSVGVQAELVEPAVVAFQRLEAGLAPQDSLDLERRLRAAFDFTKPPGRRMTASEVLHKLGNHSPSRTEQMAMGVALARVTQRRGIRSNGRKVYVLPSE